MSNKIKYLLLISIFFILIILFDGCPKMPDEFTSLVTPSLFSPSNGAINISVPTTLTWQPVVGADSYGLQVSQVNTFSSFIFNQSGLATTSKQISDLSSLTTYYWRVNSTNSLGKSNWSTVWSFTTIDQLSSSLVAFYPFNGNANDESGNANNGVVYGASLVKDRFGNEKSAYSFTNGNYIDIGDKFNDLKVPFTICCWIYKSTISQWECIFASDEFSAAYYYGFWIRADSLKITLTYGDGGYASSYARRGKVSKLTYTLNQWNFIAATVRSASDITIYINGIDAGGNYDGSGGNMKHNNYTAKIGILGFNSQQFKGIIDDISLYNISLSSDEIQTLYHKGGW